ncbi:EAL domain-containing protein [Flavobacterium sp. W21_SRS_FM6]|uniref:two-component system response regulator n=1 Tax=Flavobacterium sp. W21_SRS_FM6 TaxID=3240268 RepID=UPI003F90B8CC
MGIYTAEPKVAVSLHKPKILLVDDEPHILQALQRLLRKKECEILSANTALEALDILSKNDVQVMLTDHKMPQMTGAELIETVRHSYPNVISIMLSGQADFDQIIRLLNDKSAMRFIKKPWSNHEIVETIEKAFNLYETSSHSTWLKRINRAAGFEDDQDFASIVYRYKIRSKAHFVAAIKYVNIAALSRIVGQQECEKIQIKLVNVIAAALPPGTEFVYHEPGLLLITSPACLEKDQLTLMLTGGMAAMIEKVAGLVNSCRLELKAAFYVVDDFLLSPELLVEQLKETIQSANALRPLIYLDEALKTKLSREQQIKASISPELDSGQFTLVLQPKVTLATKLIESAEVLLRWQHTTLGWISPTEFIRLAELDGQINRVGSWVLENGIQQISRLTRFSPDIKSLSINVSARQLYQPDFVEDLQRLLKKHHVDACALEIEITESCIAEDPNYIQTVLWQVKMLGVHISIDDFGAGGTAYSFLTTLPIDTLKLDKCLVEDLSFSKSKCKLVASLIDICHSLNIDVVAEGVEDQKTLDILESMACNKVQGFIFSRALQPKDFEKLIVMQPFARKVKPQNEEGKDSGLLLC